MTCEHMHKDAPENAVCIDCYHSPIVDGESSMHEDTPSDCETSRRNSSAEGTQNQGSSLPGKKGCGEEYPQIWVERSGEKNVSYVICGKDGLCPKCRGEKGK